MTEIMTAEVQMATELMERLDAVKLEETNGENRGKENNPEKNPWKKMNNNGM